MVVTAPGVNAQPGGAVRIGVLAVQGDFEAHRTVLESIGADAFEVRSVEALGAAEGLVIPGGESTTILKGLSEYGIEGALVGRAKRGMPVFGTCAGMVVMARDGLGLLDVTVRRNAFGRQTKSFEVDLRPRDIEGGAMRCVFIRAPWVERSGANVDVMASIEGRPVLVREGGNLAAAFHPELTGDTRLHEYFVATVARARRPDRDRPGR